MSITRHDEIVAHEGVQIARVVRICGPNVRADAAPDLAVEVPHGADETAHFEALHGLMHSALPNRLIEFFYANTDVGAFAYGLRVAEEVVRCDPGRSAVVVRCLIPRTFVDTNRRIDAADELASGGLTPGLAPYFDDERDRRLLSALHRAYLDVAETCLAPTAGAGGFILLPHTYGPRSMGIAGIDADIIHNLRKAAAKGTWETWPMRPEVDLLTRDLQGKTWAPMSLVNDVATGLAAIGLDVQQSKTYALHPATQAWRWSSAHADQTLCIEIRRDVLVRRFALLEPMQSDLEKVAAVSKPIATAIDSWLAAR